MGKDELVTSADDSTATPGQTIDLKTSPSDQSGKKPEPERKIIKFDTKEKPEEQNKPKQTIPEPVKSPGASVDAAREELEQRRTMLQNMKDFDFQIKKNQEDITGLTEKVESLSKDLDDLVSLYEIVSEQMNPFVGLSKVTKKRLDALESITKEIETVKARLGDIELSVEKNPGSFEDALAVSNKTITKPEITPNQQVIPKPKTVVETKEFSSFEKNLSDTELDEILSRSLEGLLVEQNIDSMINEFFLSLK